MEDVRSVKVQFYDPVVGYENVWAMPLGDGTYRLENPPFFFYDVSLEDIVSAMPNDGGLPQFLTVVKRSGNRTLRARSKALIGDSARRSDIGNFLKSIGCVVEEHRERLLAINVPPDVDLATVTSYLTESGPEWEYGSPSKMNAA